MIKKISITPEYKKVPATKIQFFSESKDIIINHNVMEDVLVGMKEIPTIELVMKINEIIEYLNNENIK